MEQDTVHDPLFSRIESGSIEQLQFDPDNANRGTEAGNYVLTKSIQRTGLGRGVVVDKNLTLLAGNKTTEKAGELDAAEDVVYVKATGKTLVVTVREDLDLSAPEDSPEYQRARELSVSDNWASVKNTDLMTEVLEKYKTKGVKVKEYINDADWDWLISDTDNTDSQDQNEEPTDSDREPQQNPEPQQNLEPQQMPPLGDSDKVPLAIVLTQDEMFEWNQDKERLGYATDSKAFKEMWRQWKDNH